MNTNISINWLPVCLPNGSLKYVTYKVNISQYVFILLNVVYDMSDRKRVIWWLQPLYSVRYTLWYLWTCFVGYVLTSPTKNGDGVYTKRIVVKSDAKNLKPCGDYVAEQRYCITSVYTAKWQTWMGWSISRIMCSMKNDLLTDVKKSVDLRSYVTILLQQRDVDADSTNSGRWQYDNRRVYFTPDRRPHDISYHVLLSTDVVVP